MRIVFALLVGVALLTATAQAGPIVADSTAVAPATASPDGSGGAANSVNPLLSASTLFDADGTAILHVSPATRLHNLEPRGKLRAGSGSLVPEDVVVALAVNDGIASGPGGQPLLPSGFGNVGSVPGGDTPGGSTPDLPGPIKGGGGAAIPEPATVLLLAAGLVGVWRRYIH